MCALRFLKANESMIHRKPENTDEHFDVTTEEPYGVCCIEGLKVSMIMVCSPSFNGYTCEWAIILIYFAKHLFGEKRFDVGKFSKKKMGFVDDLRSQHDQNTRLVGKLGI